MTKASHLIKHLALALTLTVNHAGAQDADAWVTQGMVYEQAYDDLSAISQYEHALAVDPDHFDALWRTSRLYGRLAGRTANKDDKRRKAAIASALAQRAIAIHTRHVESRLSYIVALGMLADAEDSPADKLRYAKAIESNAVAIIRIDTAYAPAYYVMGKWHYELSKLSWLERAACNMLYGGAPEGVSLKKSVAFFDKAIHLQPDYILFHYGKACSLYKLGEYDAAIKALQHALKLRPTEPDDSARRANCLVLLEKSRQSLKL